MNSSADGSFPRGSRILVTGAAGFIGAHLVHRLVAEGADVIALVRPTSDVWRLRHLVGSIEPVRAELADLAAPVPDRRLEGVDTVYHLAAAGIDPTRLDPADVVHANVCGTLAALRFAERLRVRRFVYCGSCFEYGSGTLAREDQLPAPRSEYAASKAAGWLLARAVAERAALPVVTLRPFTVYGPLEGAHRLVPQTILAAIDGASLSLTGGEQTRDFVFIDDVVDALLAAGARDAAVGGTFNVCTGTELSVRHVVETIITLAGGEATPLFGARAYRQDELWRLSGDPRHARDTLGWQARTPLPDGLARTITWFRDHAPSFPPYGQSRIGA